jgi:alpha-galactosidase
MIKQRTNSNHAEKLNYTKSRYGKLCLVLMKIVAVVYLFTNTIGTTSAQKFENLALTPPMGWSSWNYFGCDGLNEEIIKGIADAMVETGMKDLGYKYLVVSECWNIGRDSLGNILYDEEKFPSGMKALSDYIHSKGLKMGIYSCAGSMTCAERPGSRGYEFQDARQYAEWGVDYLKYDWCYTSTQNAEASYSIMRDALYAAGRPIVFSICEWGLSKPWTWGKDVGHLWRTTGDITNNWDFPDAKEGKFWGGGVRLLLDLQKGLSKYAGPGHWNDPDMLEVGNGGLNVIEEKTHFSFWCLLAAPLIAGNDLRNMDKTTLEILTNKEAIAVNQDRLGIQGDVIFEEGNTYEIWKKTLVNNDFAVCFFNSSDSVITRSVSWKENYFNLNGNYDVRDLWKKKVIGTTSEILEIKLQPHETLFVRLISI